MYFCYFVIISRCKSLALHWNKHDSLSPNDALCQVWLKLTKWFWRRRFFFNFNNVFLIFRNNLHLEKDGALHLNQFESPSPPKDALCQVSLKSVLWLWRRRLKCEMFTDRRTNRRTKNRNLKGWQVITSLHPGNL